MKFTCKQADSLWLDLICDGVTEIDTVWDNWVGTWCLSATLGGTPLITGTLTRTTTVGLFSLHIGPTSGGVTWCTLPVGAYTLTTEINNVNADYRQELQSVIAVKTQGLV